MNRNSSHSGCSPEMKPWERSRKSPALAAFREVQEWRARSASSGQAVSLDKPNEGSRERPRSTASRERLPSMWKTFSPTMLVKRMQLASGQTRQKSLKAEAQRIGRLTRTEEKTRAGERPKTSGMISRVDERRRNLENDIPVVFRTAAERSSRVELLNLKGRHLKVCPFIKGEKELKVLSLESNAIQSLSRLTNLPNLIYLDLHNNRIQHIRGLTEVPQLKVLMLGRNQIEEIENLECLPHLDVLDLQENHIRKISHLRHLKSLRILNLSSNCIKAIENLEGLVSLIELNVSNNKISEMGCVHMLPNLLRLLITDNNLSNQASLENLFSVPRLKELSILGNPVASKPHVREQVTTFVPSLTSFDLQQIEEEKSKFLSLKEEQDEELKLPLKEEQDEKLKLSGDSAGIVVEDLGEKDSILTKRSETSNDKLVGVNVDNEKITDSLDKRLPLPRIRRTEANDRDVPGGTSEHLGWEDASTIIKSWWQQHKDKLSTVEPHTVPSFYQFRERKLRLMIYGFGFQALDFDKSCVVHTLGFHFVDFNAVSLYFHKLKHWPYLKRLDFQSNQLHTFYQLDSISTFSRLEALEIHDNPICNVPDHKNYIIFRLPHLKLYNKETIEADDFTAASRAFAPLKDVWRNPSILRTKGFLVPTLQYEHQLAANESEGERDSDISCQDIVLSWQQKESLSDNKAPTKVPSILETPDDIETRFRLFEQQWEKHVDKFVASFFQDRQSK